MPRLQQEKQDARKDPPDGVVVPQFVLLQRTPEGNSDSIQPRVRTGAARKAGEEEDAGPPIEQVTMTCTHDEEGRDGNRSHGHQTHGHLKQSLDSNQGQSVVGTIHWGANAEAPIQAMNLPNYRAITREFLERPKILGNTRTAILQRGGRKARSGLNYRIAPNEESAIKKALRTTESRKGEAIFYPYKGTVFNSVTEAKEFYNLYSWEMGFGIRLDRSRRNKATNYQGSQDIVCSSEGRPRNPNSASARTECKAKIRLLRNSDDSWYINTVIDEHNHRLTESCEENKQWGSHGYLDPTTMDFVRKLRQNNVSIGRVCDILGLTNESALTSIRKESVKSLCAKISRENMIDDMGKTLRLLEDMKRTDQAFEVRFKLDEKGTLNSMLWCTGKNRLDYANFGDAVTFDTTYRTNLYSLPFGLFVGINNHFQSVILGGVLLTTEKTADFEWAFKEFIDIMGGKAPKTILTDQCAAMAAAIKTTLKDTRHRWCRWHMLKDAKANIGPPYSKNSHFKKDFNRLITFETNKVKFEKKWKALQTRYNLLDNSFLNRLFKKREMWAKPYFMGIFCGGMTSTQRSESANHMLKSTIQKAAPMHVFVNKFRELQLGRKSAESKGEYATVQIPRKLSTANPLEAHANKVYTKAMYEVFTKQLFLSGYFAMKSIVSSRKFVLRDNRWEHPDESPETKVRLEGEDYIRCECGMYQHMGIICRHAIKVLTYLDKTEIPPGNILRRWTKICDIEGTDMQQLQRLAAENDELKRHILLRMAFEIENNRRCLSSTNFNLALQALTTAESSHEERTHEVATGKGLLSSNIGYIPTSWPTSTYRGGRPQNTSLKSWVTSTKKCRKSKASRAEEEAADWPCEENPHAAKKRHISEI
ncbi:unnamed protein product [Urochloa decumbens]|uniref:Protein FAR1-RELATED SEQUENCE n=1 Tax=Urochloa decumbens TaxID=240449 RepID=A0ABC9CK52_9POAL